MNLSLSISQLILAVGSFFLIGFNISVFHRYFKWNFRLPITQKMGVVCLLFLYTALSAKFGDPAWWRVLIGVLAMLADAFVLLEVRNRIINGEFVCLEERQPKQQAMKGYMK